MDSEIREYFTSFAFLFEENKYVSEKRILRKTHTIKDSKKRILRVNYTTEDIKKALELNIIALDHVDDKTGERYFKITEFGKKLQ